MDERDLDDVSSRPVLVPHVRQGVRRRVQLDALIGYGRVQPALFRVRELSTSGAYITRNGTTLDVGTVVEFVLRYPRLSRQLELPLAATVVRVDHEGVALRFEPYHSGAYTELVNLLYNSRSAA